MTYPSRIRPLRKQARSLKLLSFNIHAGTSTDRFHHYLTHGWRQILPHHQRVGNLDAIAEMIAAYDMVALQEADSGSLRSGFINQSRYIAAHAGLPHWFHQANRRFSNITFSGNSFMGRYKPDSVEDHHLPGVVPGRGSLVLRFGGKRGLVIAVVHLSLGGRARARQLAYLARQLAEESHLVVMGDFNTEVTSREIRAFCEALGLRAPTEGLASYPAWQPQRSIDHILVSSELRTRQVRALEAPMSDHCPVALTLDLPADLALQPAAATAAPYSRIGRASVRGLYSSAGESPLM